MFALLPSELQDIIMNLKEKLERMRLLEDIRKVGQDRARPKHQRVF